MFKNATIFLLLNCSHFMPLLGIPFICIFTCSNILKKDTRVRKIRGDLADVWLVATVYLLYVHGGYTRHHGVGQYLLADCTWRSINFSTPSAVSNYTTTFLAILITTGCFATDDWKWDVIVKHAVAMLTAITSLFSVVCTLLV